MTGLIINAHVVMCDLLVRQQYHSVNYTSTTSTQNCRYYIYFSLNPNKKKALTSIKFTHTEEDI